MTLFWWSELLSIANTILNCRCCWAFSHCNHVSSWNAWILKINYITRQKCAADVSMSYYMIPMCTPNSKQNWPESSWWAIPHPAMTNGDDTNFSTCNAKCRRTCSDHGRASPHHEWRHRRTKDHWKKRMWYPFGLCMTWNVIRDLCSEK